MNPFKKVLKIPHFILIYMIAGLVLIDYSSSSAVEVIDYQSITGFYGQSRWTNIGPDPQDKYEWYNISYLVGKDLNPWLSLETLLGPGYIKTDNFNETGSLEWRLLLNIHSRHLYFKLGAGAAYLFKSENMPDLSDSNFFSIISCSMGFRFRFKEWREDGPEITLGYSVEHLSDPFKGGEDGDIGLNVGAIKAAVSWDF
ncbi:MAG: hypothetical protein KKE44_08020 [Proteobacteria bacterium]|nr:hypothetical protein [Pseudomonadota bacterium]MBU1582674.1 hypothetical protein [Pseudomonadota bacterium]MBU2453345.1 hypothetical protein [Pseudomonadota bacterium]MBU2629658.1 hypothetical protein [Pseudomonadota bacterium]